jgi:hypothetical protein
MQATYIKLYTDQTQDCRWGMLDDTARAVWVEALALSKSMNLKGKLPQLRDLAYRLRRPAEQVSSAMAQLCDPEIGWIEQTEAGWQVAGWDRWQSEPESNAERQRAWKQRHGVTSGNAQVTRGNASNAQVTDGNEGNATEIEIETKTETERENRTLPPPQRERTDAHTHEGRTPKPGTAEYRWAVEDGEITPEGEPVRQKQQQPLRVTPPPPMPKGLDLTDRDILDFLVQFVRTSPAMANNKRTGFSVQAPFIIKNLDAVIAGKLEGLTMPLAEYCDVAVANARVAAEDAQRALDSWPPNSDGPRYARDKSQADFRKAEAERLAQLTSRVKRMLNDA